MLPRVGLLDVKASVQKPGQPSPTKRKITKYFFRDFLLADFWQKKKINKFAMKSFSKICRSESGGASHIAHVVCVNFTRKARDLTSIPNDRFFKIIAGLFTVRVFARNLLRGNRQRNIFFSYFVLMPELGYEPAFYV